MLHSGKGIPASHLIENSVRPWYGHCSNGQLVCRSRSTWRYLYFERTDAWYRGSFAASRQGCNGLVQEWRASARQSQCPMPAPCNHLTKMRKAHHRGIPSELPSFQVITPSQLHLPIVTVARALAGGLPWALAQPSIQWDGVRPIQAGTTA